MRFGVLVDGQLARRRLMPRQRDAEKVVSDIDVWLRSEYADAVRAISIGTSDDDVRELTFSLHPAAEPVRLTATDAGAIHLAAATVNVGPGYERLVWRLIERLAETQSIDWQPDIEAGADLAEGLPVGAWPAASRPSVERTHLAWLGWALNQARDARRLGIPAIHLATPRAARYGLDAALLSRLGPRDDAWLDRAISDPRVAIDVWPWWTDATDARYLLDRALSLMWTDVRWRNPGDPDEAAVQDDVLRLLRKAFPLDPGLPYPWREWRELLEIRGVDDPQTRVVFDRAKDIDPSQPLIGYRREPVRIDQGGWTLEVPGSFAERRTSDEWTGGESGRSVTVAGTMTGTASGPMSGEAFLARVAVNLGSDTLEHRDGPLVGRARLAVNDEAGMQVAVLDGFSAVAGLGAAIRIVIHDAADWEWAIELWRSLRPTRHIAGDHIDAPGPTAVLAAESDRAAGRAAPARPAPDTSSSGARSAIPAEAR